MTHIKQQTFLAANSHRGQNYSFTIDLHNSPMALHANSCLIFMDRRVSDSFELHSKAYMGHMQHKFFLCAHVTSLFRFSHIK